jgi:cytochrome bd-type quinol oxidase subunit 1
MGSSEVILGVGVLIAAFQLWVSVQLIRASHYESLQKWLQLLLIWLVPLLGAIVVQSMMRTEGRAPYKPEKGYTEPGDNAS